MSKCEIDFQSIDKALIKVDGEEVNGMSRIEVDVKAGFLPKVRLTPAVNELQFGNRAAVDVYVGHLESKTARMLLKSIQNHLSIVDPEEIGDSLTASEAIFGFAAWLTARPEVITLSAKHDAAPIVDLIGKFMDENNLASPRSDVYPDNLTMPKEEELDADVGSGNEVSGD